MSYSEDGLKHRKAAWCALSLLHIRPFSVLQLNRAAGFAAALPFISRMLARHRATACLQRFRMCCHSDWLSEIHSVHLCDRSASTNAMPWRFRRHQHSFGISPMKNSRYRRRGYSCACSTHSIRHQLKEGLSSQSEVCLLLYVRGS